MVVKHGEAFLFLEHSCRHVSSQVSFFFACYIFFKENVGSRNKRRKIHGGSCSRKRRKKKEKEKEEKKIPFFPLLFFFIFPLFFLLNLLLKNYNYLVRNQCFYNNILMVILLSRIQLLVAKFFAIFSIIKFSRLKCFCFFAFIFLKEKKRKKEDFL
jgi:hypothetical protein